MHIKTKTSKSKPQNYVVVVDKTTTNEAVETERQVYWEFGNIKKKYIHICGISIFELTNLVFKTTTATRHRRQKPEGNKHIIHHCKTETETDAKMTFKSNQHI